MQKKTENQSQRDKNNKGNKIKQNWKLEIKKTRKINHSPLQRKPKSEYPWSSKCTKNQTPKAKNKCKDKIQSSVYFASSL